jgi:hypothetical protein
MTTSSSISVKPRRLVFLIDASDPRLRGMTCPEGGDHGTLTPGLLYFFFAFFEPGVCLPYVFVFIFLNRSSI